MRRRPTEAEREFWLLLRDRRLNGYKFRQQVPIGRYIPDFACFEARLVVEIDGSQHAGSVRDGVRDDWLRSQGFRVLRVWNNDMTANRNGVLDAVWHSLEEGYSK